MPSCSPVRAPQYAYIWKGQRPGFCVWRLKRAPGKKSAKGRLIAAPSLSSRFSGNFDQSAI